MNAQKSVSFLCYLQKKSQLSLLNLVEFAGDGGITCALNDLKIIF